MITDQTGNKIFPFWSNLGMTLLADFGPETSRASDVTLRKDGHRSSKRTSHRRRSHQPSRSTRPVSDMLYAPASYPGLMQPPASIPGMAANAPYPSHVTAASRSRSSQGSMGSDCSAESRGSRGSSKSQKMREQELADLYLNTKAGMVS